MSYLGKFRLDGKVAVVTGGAGILGSHFCKGLAEAGAHVVVLDVDLARSQLLADALPTSSIGLVCDVSKAESVKQTVADIVAKFGRIDVLINNAATKTDDLKALFKPFEEYELSTWQDVMAVNIDGMFLMAQAVGKQMLAQGTGGSIIQTSSIYGVMAPDPRIYEGSDYLGGPINTPAVYSASKAAVVGLTKWLATYWADKGIRTNCLVPGGVASGQNDTFNQKYSNRIPMGRMAEAEEMVSTVLFLASDASSYVTGQVHCVDGGLSCW